VAEAARRVAEEVRRAEAVAEAARREQDEAAREAELEIKRVQYEKEVHI